MLDHLTVIECLWTMPGLDGMTWPDLGRDDDRLVELSESEIAFDARHGIAWRQADQAWTTTVAAVWAAYTEEFDRLLDHVQVLAPTVRVLVGRPPHLSRPGVTFVRGGWAGHSDGHSTASKRLRRLLSAAIRTHGATDERIVDLDRWLGVLDTTFQGVIRGEPVLLSRAFLPVLAEWLRGRDLAHGTYHRMIRAEVGFPTARFATGFADLTSGLAEETERLATAFRTGGLTGFRDAARAVLDLQATFPPAPGHVVLDLMFAERAPGVVEVVPALGLTVPPPPAGFPLTLADGSLIGLHRAPWTMSARMFGDVGRNGPPAGRTLSTAGELTRTHQPPAPVAVSDIVHGCAEPPDLDAVLELVDALRGQGANLASLDLLSRYTDQSWTSTSDQLRWLDALIDVFRALSEDFTAAELCLRAIGLDDRISRAAVGVLGQRDYTLITRAYDVLVDFQTGLERLAGTSQGRALSYLEAAKEAAFSRALPGLREDAHSAEVAALVAELAHLEAEDERRLRTDLSTPRGAGGRIVIRSGYEDEQDRQRRCARIRDRLGQLRGGPGAVLTRFTSCLDVTPDSLPDLWSAADWPPDAVALAYRLDRAEDELVSYLIRSDGCHRRHVVEVAPTSIDSLLEMAIQYPEEELGYIAERLTALMLPPPVHEALVAAKARTLIVSGDASLPSVPWEALGPAGDQLGLRFQVCRSPSLLRTATQVVAAPEPETTVDRALIVADPTADLPAARREGAEVRELLAAHGVDVTVLTACSRAEFARALPRFPLVHFAGHTNFLRTDPSSSHFVLSDGPFTAADLAGTPLYPGGVFVLGSCESAQSGPETSDGGSLGLATVLLLNGAGAVVGTNWLAEDSESLAAAEHLYPHLVRGKSVAAALHETRRDLYRLGTPGWMSFTALGHPFLRVS